MDELHSAVCRSCGVWPHESAQHILCLSLRKEAERGAAGSPRHSTERYSKARAWHEHE
jgi:hypothetical protein